MPKKSPRTFYAFFTHSVCVYICGTYAGFCEKSEGYAGWGTYFVSECNETRKEGRKEEVVYCASLFHISIHVMEDLICLSNNLISLAFTMSAGCIHACSWLPLQASELDLESSTRSCIPWKRHNESKLLRSSSLPCFSQSSSDRRTESDPISKSIVRRQHLHWLTLSGLFMYGKWMNIDRDSRA